MKILRVIGLGLAIIMIGLLMPEVFKVFENVLLKFFGLLDTVLSVSGANLSRANLYGAELSRADS